MKRMIFATILSSFIFLASCGSSTKINRKVVVKQPAKVLFEDNTEKSLKENEEIEFDGRSMLIEAPGHISVLIVPVGDEKQNVQIDLKEFDKRSFNRSLFSIYNKDLTDIFTKVHEIQKKIQEDKAQEALNMIEKLREKYPSLSYLNFLKASIYYVLGEKGKTKRTLELALEEYPGHEEALALYSSLLEKGERNKFLGDKK